METQLAIAFDLGLLDQESYETLDRESYQVLGLLNRLIDSFKTKPTVISRRS